MGRKSTIANNRLNYASQLLNAIETLNVSCLLRDNETCLSSQNVLLLPPLPSLTSSNVFGRILCFGNEWLLPEKF